MNVSIENIWGRFCVVLGSCGWSGFVICGGCCCCVDV